MQLGDPTSVTEASSAEAAMAVEAAEAPPPPPAEAAPPEGGADVNGGGEIIIGMDATTTSSGEGDKINSGGNRWPRPETLALLKIRSDMDAVFRDSSLKGPLWEEVSRKLGELGYKRSAKKCKEKFENVYKYHKRTKDSRSAKPEGKAKTYRFFDQLQALESRFTLSHSHSHSQSQPPKPPYPQPSNLATNTLSSLPFPARPGDHSSTTIPYVTIASAAAATTAVPSTNPSLANANFFATTTTTSTSSSTASDEDLEERYRKKRKWKDYFRRLTRQVLARQEEMQKRFLDTIEKRECERVAQLEAWRMQEMARINREHEILVQERSTAAAKDAAVVAFLQKLSGGTPQMQPPPPPPLPLPVVSQLQAQQQQQRSQQPQLAVMPNNNNNGNYEKFEIQKMNYNNNISNVGGGGGGGGGNASSRWPKAEVHALIRLRTSLDAKYQDNGPKAPLWEEISSGMQRLGYNRSAKRCKEKWENINKYFKKIKESNKHRREDSKTCPYFNELEALYKEKSKTQNNNPFGSFGHNVEPLMVQPEQQWRPPTQEGVERENASQYQECEEQEEEDDDGGGGEEEMDLEDEEGGGGGYEINKATNKLSPVDTVE